MEACNYASLLRDLKHFEEASSLMRRLIPVARRSFGESDVTSLTMVRIYVLTLNNVDTATLDDLRGAMTMLEKADRTARRVLGSGHPLARAIGQTLRNARVVLRAREMRQS